MQSGCLAVRPMQLRSRLGVTGVLFGAILAASSCGTETGPSDLVDVEIAADPTEASFGESIMISVTTTNRSLRRVVVNGGTCPQPFEVLDDERLVVGPEHLICLLVATMVTLDPGESMTLSSTWSGLGRSGGLDDPMPLAPGEYSLRGRTSLRSYGTAYSEPLRVRVMP
jgi:hypothetical protein